MEPDKNPCSEQGSTKVYHIAIAKLTVLVAYFLANVKSREDSELKFKPYSRLGLSFSPALPTGSLS